MSTGAEESTTFYETLFAGITVPGDGVDLLKGEFTNSKEGRRLVKFNHEPRRAHTRLRLRLLREWWLPGGVQL